MKRHVRTTLVYGLISALAVMPSAWALTAYIGWPLAFKLMLWADLFGYAILLTRWSGKDLGSIVFPLALLLGTAVWPGVYAAYFFLGLGMFSWLRSGICFTGAPMRAIAAETITVAGGAGLVALLSPGPALTWSISIWLFFLVQALYFFIVPANEPVTALPMLVDPFEQACREALRVLDEFG